MCRDFRCNSESLLEQTIDKSENSLNRQLLFLGPDNHVHEYIEI